MVQWTVTEFSNWVTPKRLRKIEFVCGMYL